MRYDPRSFSDRCSLARELITKLESCGFSPTEIPGTQEKVYQRQVPNTSLWITVYTTVVVDSFDPNGALCVRTSGSDAIRVVLLHTKNRTRGVGKERRVNRTGTIPRITHRMHERMRDAYLKALETERCSSCGSALFLSKKKNQVCADLCWKNR